MRTGEGTKFTIDRKIFSSDIWFSSPWKLKIWIYLVGQANHQDNKFMGTEIKRGQLIRSYRTIQKDCAYKIGYRIKKPSLSTVRRICEELTKDARMTQRTVQAGTLFTICNYNDLQPFQKERTVQRKNDEENNSGTVAELNKNDKNEKNVKKKKIGYPDWLDLDLWAEFKKFRTKIKASLTDHAEKVNLDKLTSLKLQGNDPVEVINQTIERGWKGFFPVNNNTTGKAGLLQPTTYAQAQDAERREMVNRLLKDRINETGNSNQGNREIIGLLPAGKEKPS